MQFRTELMACERDFGSVHNFYVKLPVSHGIPFESILKDADSIYAAFPDDELLKFASASVKDLVSNGRFAIPLLLIFI